MTEQQFTQTIGPVLAPSDTAIQEFKSRLRGELIGPGDAAYDAARTVYNGMIDKPPALIARCADVADAIAAVTFARDNQLPLAVRNGGHNGAGLGMCDDGLVIDLSHMKGIRVDPAQRTVRVEGGCTLGDVDHATHAFGLTTGVGGLTLGGGLGHLTRKCCLTGVVTSFLFKLQPISTVYAGPVLWHLDQAAEALRFWHVTVASGKT